MSRRTKHTLCYALAMLASVASIAPPAIRHVHPGGDQPHDLATTEASRHGHRHSVGGHHHHEHASSESAEVAALGDLAWHLHFEWMGIEVTLPSSSPPLDESDEQDGPVLVRPDSPMIVKGSAEEQTARVATILCCPSIAGDGTVVCRVLRGLHQQRTEALLCDTARQWRSGVQLI